MIKRNLVNDGVRRALAMGVASSLVAGTSMPVIAQEDVARQERITVTGSRIKRIDIEGPSPISIISREDIDATGETSLAEVLRDLSFNTHGSWRPKTGVISQSQSGISLRGLGSQRTLVLIDGRRVTNSPTNLGGLGTNLSTIPLAAVERVEILRDGASAIYGSDAIGGVVNIIMRKDYEGIQLSYSLGRPTQTGGDEENYSIVGGVSGRKGNITFSFESQQKDIIFDADRSFSATALSSFGFPGSYFAYLTTDDPRNPIDSFLSVGVFADPRCPAELDTPEFPASRLASFGTPDGQALCQFNYASFSTSEAENDAKSFFLNANYEINEDTTFFVRGTFTFNESLGQYEPSSVTSTFPIISQANPNNPTNPVLNPTNVDGQSFAGQSVDIDGDGTADLDGPFDVSLFYRNVPGGLQGKFVEDTLIDYMAGVQGTVDWLGGLDWEFAAQYSKQRADTKNTGVAEALLIQEQIDIGALDIFATNSDSGDFSTGLNDGIVASAEAASATYKYEADTRIASADFTANFDAFHTRNGAVPVALGTEYRDEKFTANDGGQHGTSGERAVKALFGETTIPVLATLDINLAVRWEDYNDFGTTTNPKLAVAYRPLDSLLIRGSWGTGFRAPGMPELIEPAAPISGNQSAIDTTQCAADPLGDANTGRAPPGSDLPPGNPCLPDRFLGFFGGNRDLDPETSTQWSAGVVWNPLNDLSIALDWYDIEIEDEISIPPMQTTLDNEFRLRNTGATGDDVGRVMRQPNGRVESVDLSFKNQARRETDGLDVDASFGFSFTQVGDFRLTAMWTYVNNYEVDQGDGLGPGESQLFDPDHRGTIGLNWTLGNFGANMLWNYIADSSIQHSDGERRIHLDSMETWDLQLSYATPWNGQLTLGARNLFDEDPPTSENLGFPHYYSRLHDVYGRVPYLRYQQEL